MIDLDAYCQRINHAGPRDATLATLSALCSKHPASIVFENIDPLLGRAPSLALPALQAKLIAQGRGGYCFEQNLLLREALLAVGMEVTALAARVVWRRPPEAPPRARSHMLLSVRLPGGEAGPFIADAGFGGQLTNTPLRLEPGLVQQTPHATLRFTLGGTVYTLETLLPTGWVPVYCFTLEPHLPIDYEPLNWFTATHPDSMFRHNLLMERLTPDLRISLVNDRLVLRRPNAPPEERRLTSRREFDEVLETQFGLRLDAPMRDLLYERVPKGLDQPVVPTR